MTTEPLGNVFAARMEQLKQQRNEQLADIPVFTPKQPSDYKLPPLPIKPAPSTWDELVEKLTPFINLPGFWNTVRELYDAGYGAELETAAEIAHATARKDQINLFTSMVSKKSGNWETRTLKTVHESWQVRRNALEVMDKLKLKADSVKAILAIAWRLKDTIIRYLGIATEQGVNIRNPIGLFFALTKKPKLLGT